MVKANVDKILDVLRQKKKSSVAEISSDTGVPKEDILKSAEYLEEDGVVKIEHKFPKVFVEMIKDPDQKPEVKPEEMPAPQIDTSQGFDNAKPSIPPPPAPQQSTAPGMPPAPKMSVTYTGTQAPKSGSQPAVPVTGQQNMPPPPKSRSMPAPPAPKTDPGKQNMPPPPKSPSMPAPPAPKSDPGKQSMPPPPSAPGNTQKKGSVPVPQADSTHNPPNIAGLPPKSGGNEIQGQQPVPKSPASAPAANPAQGQNNLSDMGNLTGSGQFAPLPGLSSPEFSNTYDKNEDPLEVEKPKFNMNVPDPGKEEGIGTPDQMGFGGEFRPKAQHHFPEYARTDIDKIDYLIEQATKQIQKNQYLDLNVSYREIYDMYQHAELSPNERYIIGEKLNELFHRIKRVYLIETKAF